MVQATGYSEDQAPYPSLLASSIDAAEDSSEQLQPTEAETGDSVSAEELVPTLEEFDPSILVLAS
jgi:hypothetical protein